MRTPPSEMTCGFLIQLLFCKKKTVCFIGVEIEQETSAPPPKMNPGSAPADVRLKLLLIRARRKVHPFSRLFSPIVKHDYKADK